MPRVTHVKHARKDYPQYDIKQGDEYYWWKFRFGSKHKSKTTPARSQLTQSEFLSTIYDLEDRLGALSAEGSTREDVQSDVDSIKDELEALASQCEDNRSNMPESLQDSESGQLLETRAEAVQNMISALESIDLEDNLEDAVTELQGISYEGD